MGHLPTYFIIIFCITMGLPTYILLPTTSTQQQQDCYYFKNHNIFKKHDEKPGCLIQRPKNKTTLQLFPKSEDKSAIYSYVIFPVNPPIKKIQCAIFFLYIFFLSLDGSLQSIHSSIKCI